MAPIRLHRAMTKLLKVTIPRQMAPLLSHSHMDHILSHISHLINLLTITTTITTVTVTIITKLLIIIMVLVLIIGDQVIPDTNPCSGDPPVYHAMVSFISQDPYPVH